MTTVPTASDTSNNLLLDAAKNKEANDDHKHDKQENIPLIDKKHKNATTPPLASFEAEDLEPENGSEAPSIDPYPGIDDSFFISNRAGEPDVVPPKPEDKPGDEADGHKQPYGPHGPEYYGHRAFPFAPGYGHYDPELGIVPSDLETIPDVNVYQHKKTLAQGMMDLALFSANANQLRYVLESYNRHPYYYPSLVMISISLVFQVAVGVGLIWNSRYNVKDKKEICIANKINNFTIIGIFLVTVINVFVSAFGVANIEPIT